MRTVKNYVKAFWLLRKMLKNQWLSREQVETIQNSKLQKLVSHAYNKVPYYYRLFNKAGIRPEEIKTVRDLQKIPVTTKVNLRALQPQDVMAGNIDLKHYHTRKTSGSSGVPLTVFHNDYILMLAYCLLVRAHYFFNCRITDKILCIGPTYYPVNLLPQRFGIFKVKTLEPFVGAEEYIKVMNSYRPDILVCYPSVLKSLLRYVKNSKKVHTRLAYRSQEASFLIISLMKMQGKY